MQLSTAQLYCLLDFTIQILEALLCILIFQNLFLLRISQLRCGFSRTFCGIDAIIYRINSTIQLNSVANKPISKVVYVRNHLSHLRTAMVHIFEISSYFYIQLPL